MERNCDNCRWLLTHSFCKKDNPNDNICEEHNFICKSCGGIATYKYKGEFYCSDCVIGQFDVEEETVTRYYLNGEYIGNSDNFDEIIDNLDGVEEIE